MQDDLGDRMKSYEQVETARKIDTTKPYYARIDGRGFSKFTAGLERPFDPRMSVAMMATTKYLVDKTHARLGYTQSDEISLVFLHEGESAGGLFGGKVQKLVSVLASMAATSFHAAIRKTPGIEHYAERLPHFDCRVFQLPDRSEAANAILWRERDAQKNSISMAARTVFSHRELQKKSTREMLDMMAKADLDYSAYPDYFKRGTFMRRVTETRTLTAEELAAIPEAHRPPPEMTFERSDVRIVPMPDFTTVKNRVGVIFDGEAPVVNEIKEEAA